MQNTATLYETDFFAWTQEQVKLIKQKALEKLDMIHLCEEVESMGVSQRNALESRLGVLLMHLLKWKYQPSRQCRSWTITIKVQRKELTHHLKKNPSLTNIDTLKESFEYAYSVAILNAAEETGLDDDIFPKQCEWTIGQVLDDEFFPN